MKTNDQLEPAVFAIFGGVGDLTWRRLKELRTWTTSGETNMLEHHNHRS